MRKKQGILKIGGEANTIKHWKKRWLNHKWSIALKPLAYHFRTDANITFKYIKIKSIISNSEKNIGIYQIHEWKIIPKHKFNLWNHKRKYELI